VNHTHLTVELVETLQMMLMKGKEVSPLFENLRSASLPALLEYGCLRFAFGEKVPNLPKAIISADEWQPLRAIKSEIGFSTNGPRKAEPKDLSPRPMEFTTVWAEEDTLESAWENFLHRFERSMKAAGFGANAALNLQSALHEMATNAVIHSRTSVPALVGYAVRQNSALFSVVDVGQGIVSSLTSNPKYSYLTQPVEAIQKALQTGVTCRVDNSGGFGFSTIFKALAEAWGQLRFRSGNGCITMDGIGLDVDQSVRHFPPPLPGFQVSICCNAADGSPLKM
jgi:anti-sigma regulatory factor (Ser/Thr protein kinase)